MWYEERKSHFFGDICQTSLQTQGDLWLCAVSRVNHPGSFLGHGGVRWRNVHGLKTVTTLPMLVKSNYHVHFCYVFKTTIRTTSYQVKTTALQNFSPSSVMSQKSVYFWKRYSSEQHCSHHFCLIVIAPFIAYKGFVYFPKYWP